MAPELCDPDLDTIRGKPLDVWALGITVYALLFNRVPFDGATEHLVMESIREKPFEIPEDRPISKEMREILLALCEKDVEKRITLD